MPEQHRQVIVYGGAFNPPTIAHHAILQACIDRARAIGAEVWILPSGNRTDKAINAEERQRIAYLRALVSDLDAHGVDVRINTTELTRMVMVETYDTVREFAAVYPDKTFIWVFGADSTQTMRAWKEGAWLMRNIEMLLLQRPGSTINPGVRRYTTLTIPVMAVSSTELRRRLATGEDYRDLVSPSVYRMLRQQYGELTVDRRLDSVVS